MYCTRPFFQRTRLLNRHVGIVNELQFSPDGTILASLGTSPQMLNSNPYVSHEVCLWDVQSCKVVASFPIYELETFDINTINVFFSSILFVSRSRLLVGTTNGLIIQLDINYKSRNIKFRLQSLKNGEIEISHLTQSPDPTIFACSLNDVVIVFCIPKGSSVEGLHVRHILLPHASHGDAHRVGILHWMRNTISASELLIGYGNGHIDVWDINTGLQIRHCRLSAAIDAGQVIDNEKRLAIYNGESFSTEIYSLKNGAKVRDVFRETITGPGLSLPLLSIPERSCLVLGSHSGKGYLHYVAKEEPYEVLQPKESHPILCLAYYHNPEIEKTILVTGSMPGPHSTEFACISLWETDQASRPRPLLWIVCLKIVCLWALISVLVLAISLRFDITLPGYRITAGRWLSHLCVISYLVG